MKENAETHYKILGVEPIASSETIRQAYLKLVSEYHPATSVTTNMSKEERTAREERYRNIIVAYDELKDDKKRAAYDKKLEAKEELVFEIVEGSSSSDVSGNERSLVVRTPISFLDTIKAAATSVEDLETRAIEDFAFAKAIIDNKEFLNRFACSNLLRIGLAHEEFAKLLVSREDLRTKMSAIPNFIFRLTEKYASVCQIVFENKTLALLLNGEELFKLHEKYKNKLKPLDSEISRIIDAYRELQSYSNPNKKMIELEGFKQLVQAANLKKPTSDNKEILEKMAINNVQFASVLLHDTEFVDFFDRSNLLRMGVANEGIAKLLVSDKRLRTKMEGVSNFIFQLAEKYASVCQIVFENKNLALLLNGEQLFNLREKYKYILKKLDPEISRIIDAYWELQTYLRPNKKMIELEGFKQLVQAANLKKPTSDNKEILEKVAINNVQFAGILLDDAEFVDFFDCSNLLHMGLANEVIARWLVSREHLRTKMATIPDFVFQLAEKYVSVCQIIFSNDSQLAFKFTGKQLFTLTSNHGSAVANLITDPKLTETLQAHILLDLVKKLKIEVKKGNVSSAPIKTETEQLYKLGLVYQKQGTPESDGVAQDYFYKAAKMGHDLSLQAYIAFVEKHPDPVQQIKIAEIYLQYPDLDSEHTQVKFWSEKASTTLRYAEALHVLSFIKERLLVLSTSKAVSDLPFYLDIADKAINVLWYKTCFYYRDIALIIINLDPKTAFNWLERVPEKYRSSEDWCLLGQMMANRQESVDTERFNLALPYYSKAIQKANSIYDNYERREKQNNFLYTSLNSILRNNNCQGEVLRLLEEIYKLPTQYKTIREEFNLCVAAILNSQEVTDIQLSAIRKKLVIIQGRIIQLNNLSDDANTLPPQWKDVRREIGHLVFMTEIHDDSTLSTMRDKITKNKEIASKLHNIKNEIEKLPASYITIKQDYEMFLRSDISLYISNDPKNRIPTFLNKFDEIKHIRQSLLEAQNRASNLPQNYQAIKKEIEKHLSREGCTLENVKNIQDKIDKLEETKEQLTKQQNGLEIVFRNFNTYIAGLTAKDSNKSSENRFSNKTITALNNLISELKVEVTKYYERDFSNPKLERNDSVFSTTLLGIVDQHLKQSRSDLKEATNVVYELAYWLIKQIKEIFTEGTAPHRWLTTASNFFKPVSEVEKRVEGLRSDLSNVSNLSSKSLDLSGSEEPLFSTPDSDPTVITFQIGS